jgi:hypothetical protein
MRGVSILKGRFSVLAVAVFSVLLLGNWADWAPAQEGEDGSKRELGGLGDVMLKIRGDQGTRFSDPLARQGSVLRTSP